MKRMNSGNKFNNIRLQAMSQLFSFLQSDNQFFLLCTKNFVMKNIEIKVKII